VAILMKLFRITAIEKSQKAHDFSQRKKGCHWLT
jgi:hypothetical protein